MGRKIKQKISKNCTRISTYHYNVNKGGNSLTSSRLNKSRNNIKYSDLVLRETVTTLTLGFL